MKIWTLKNNLFFDRKGFNKICIKFWLFSINKSEQYEAKMLFCAQKGPIFTFNPSHPPHFEQILNKFWTNSYWVSLYWVSLTVCHFTDCHFTQCHFTQCPCTQCHYSECHLTDCNYTGCNYAECRDSYYLAIIKVHTLESQSLTWPKLFFSGLFSSLELQLFWFQTHKPFFFVIDCQGLYYKTLTKEH